MNDWLEKPKLIGSAILAFIATIIVGIFTFTGNKEPTVLKLPEERRSPKSDIEKPAIPDKEKKPAIIKPDTIGAEEEKPKATSPNNERNQINPSPEENKKADAKSEKKPIKPFGNNKENANNEPPPITPARNDWSTINNIAVDDESYESGGIAKLFVYLNAGLEKWEVAAGAAWLEPQIQGRVFHLRLEKVYSEKAERQGKYLMYNFRPEEGESGQKFMTLSLGTRTITTAARRVIIRQIGQELLEVELTKKPKLQQGGIIKLTDIEFIKSRSEIRLHLQAGEGVAAEVFPEILQQHMIEFQKESYAPANQDQRQLENSSLHYFLFIDEIAEPLRQQRWNQYGDDFISTVASVAGDNKYVAVSFNLNGMSRVKKEIDYYQIIAVESERSKFTVLIKAPM